MMPPESTYRRLRVMLSQKCFDAIRYMPDSLCKSNGYRGDAADNVHKEPILSA